MDAQVCIEPGNAGPIHVVLGGPGAPYLKMWGTRDGCVVVDGWESGAGGWGWPDRYPRPHGAGYAEGGCAGVEAAHSPG